MAYGKLKADTLVYDNSGSDTEVTISSLGNKANLPASAGTVGTSEVVQVDANKDITGFRNITLSGDLTVNGTTTTIDSTTLTVEDKNIELGKVGTPTDATADGGGITLKGASDKEIKWVNATNSWTFNKNIEITTGTLTVKGIEGISANLYLIADEGDDNGDGWRVGSNQDDNDLTFANNTSGSYVDKLTLLNNGNATFGGSVTASSNLIDSKGNVRDVIQNTQTSAYTLAGTDAGKHILISSGGVTVPGSVFGAGNAVTIVNNSGSDQTITQGSGITVYNTADAATGNRTLAGRGMCTILFASGTAAYISGAGLS